MDKPSDDGSITPEDPKDVALLRVAEGALFGATTLPSGWKCPPGPFIAKDGKLWPVGA